ncbi:MAG TPA: hypothetical protein VMI94_10780 [Bryobacteraceae bacterium]|nr:hypothetical protein [Bryobacteraceae bacterium]
MMQRVSPCLIALALGGVLLAPSAAARSHKHKPKPPADFAYYMLVLSYAPDFCDQSGVPKDPRECGTGRHVGFVVHGLWPQGESARGPENCGSASPVSDAIVQATLSYIPTESLIQHEWKAHGSCSGLSAADYFAALRKARDSITLPPELNQPSETLHLSPGEIETKVAGANPGLPAESVRTSCYRGGELQEVRICFDKDLAHLTPRACGPSAGECSGTSETMLPVQ